MSITQRKARTIIKAALVSSRRLSKKPESRTESVRCTRRLLPWILSPHRYGAV